jgi:HK97 family phage portal protein
MSTELEIRPGLADRLSAAWKTLKGDFSFSSSQSYGYGGGGLSGWPGWIGSGPYFKNTKVDYASEVGDLTSSSLIMAAVRWTGNAITEPMLEVKESKEKGDSSVVTNHPLVKLLNNPNSYYGSSTLWKAFSLSWIVDGNVYFYKLRNKFNQVIGLVYIPHWMLIPRHPLNDKTIYVSYYEYRVDGELFQVAPEDIVHFRNGTDPYNVRRGLSPVGSLLREIYADNETSNYSALLMKNSGVPPYVIVPKEGVVIDDPTREQVKAELVRRSSGDERGKPLFLTGSLEIKELGFEPRKMDLKSLRRLPEERVASVLGIPGMVLGFGAHLERSTYSNYQQAAEMAYQSFLTPLWKDIERDLTKQLLPDFEKNESRYVAHDLSGVQALQEDANKRAERFAKLYSFGIAKRSEARSAVGLPVATDGTDDVFFDPRGGSLLQPGEDPLNTTGSGQQPEPAKSTEFASNGHGRT